MTEKTDQVKFSKKSLVSEIADDLNIRVEVVEAILERFTDIAIEKIVNDEGFTLMNVFSVNPHDEGKLVIPESSNGEVPSQVVEGRKKIHSRLSRNVRALYRLQNDKFPDKPNIVNRDNWRDALKWAKQKKIQNRPQQPEKPTITPDHTVVDDMFYEDDLD